VSARRLGFSLAELMVSLVIAGVIGVALSRLIISQSRFVSMQDAMMRARSASRAALNVMSGDLRALTDSGLVQASADSITVRVPYAFGLACQQSGGTTIVSLLPTDSSLFGSARASGYAWRDSATATYIFKQPATVGVGVCSAPVPAITTLSATGWSARSVAVSPAVSGVGGTPVGAVVYLYQLVRYAFAPSVEIPGRRALWRSVLSAGTRDEMVTPFDSSARFQFLVGNTYALQATPPAVLDSVRGIRVKLVGASETAPQGRTTPVKFDLTSDILFRNNARQ
jgi:prepilin-type N-terminal cleavage/methylation domain-containing protein